ncbi:peptide chain release factor N(5)-glutamine methyltransferase [Alkalicella caledoniensis]|uniref:Release factor glutamine methyltransferase n=1 Tax=Alkalicella caledoniensis TaxID=2731377 RepID=A0A7G9W8Y0_ALKCA|nr:peptide chain release factor N(5)-glutamine methyltransferase [Alkalicella caledoniensis]QNO15142.1 peptide chain release factor N(5)-glutamine methyltransferase [Alkalicella caledoniensis]
MSQTIKEALIWASSYLKENNIENPYFESQLLLRYLLDTTFAKLKIYEDTHLKSEDLIIYKEYVGKRGSGYPFAYIVKEKQFMGLDFFVDERVLIPRPDTENLVQWALGYIERNGSGELKVVDIGTGSGAISLSIAKLSKAYVYAVDISKDSLDVCRINRTRLDLEHKVELFNGSLSLPLLEKNIKVDLVLANLPYIPEKQFSTLQKEVKEHEPYGALIGGYTGLEIYEELLTQIAGVLNPGGAMAIEIAYHQGQEATALLKDSGFEEVYIVKDLSGHDRVVIGENYAEKKHL